MGHVNGPGKISEETVEGSHQRLSPRDENIVIARNGRKGKDGTRRFPKAAFRAISLDSAAHLAACGHAVADRIGLSTGIGRRRDLECQRGLGPPHALGRMHEVGALLYRGEPQGTHRF
jgi:hypothetical protein